MGPKMLITVWLGILLCIAGTSLVTAQSHYPWFGQKSNQGPAPGKRSAIPRNLEARNFIRGETLWKRVNRQRYDEDR